MKNMLMLCVFLVSVYALFTHNYLATSMTVVIAAVVSGIGLVKI